MTVARFLGQPDMTQRVTDAVRVHQDDYTAIDFATAFAELLQRVIQGATVAEALKWGAFEKKPPLYDDQKIYVQLARALHCPLPAIPPACPPPTPGGYRS